MTRIVRATYRYKRPLSAQEVQRRADLADAIMQEFRRQIA
jgi:hypothetical protein